MPTDKNGMDKINESMERIGAMLGVRPSASEDSKNEALINKSDSESDFSLKKLLSMNSAEGKVLAPPRRSNDKDSIGEDTTTTRPTEPMRTKTAAGAAIAGFAATLDNGINNVSKSFRDSCGGGEADLEADQTFIPPDHGPKKLTPAQQVKLAAKEAQVKVEKVATTTPTWILVTGLSTLAILLALGISAAIPGTLLNQKVSDYQATQNVKNENNISIAMIGNSYFYVNDVPRLMEAISDGHIEQQSVINTGVGLGSLLKQGNGMYNLWQTPNAKDYASSTQDMPVYDYGYCTVPQLLDGFDNYLTYNNMYGIYWDAGSNPCFEDENYLSFLQAKIANQPFYFDYVILNDQSRRMAVEEAREDTIQALEQAYIPLIMNSRARPLLVDTHAFLYENGTGVWDEMYNNETFIGSDVVLFQNAIYEGLYEYMEVLKSNLPSRQSPEIVKIGMTYLAIYNNDREMWTKLFADDGIHASAYGSYLFSVVLYCTLYGHLPKPVNDDSSVRELFMDTRSKLGDGIVYPTKNEADYLRKMAKKVVLQGHVPRNLKIPKMSSESLEEGANMTNYTEYGEEAAEKEGYSYN